MIISPKALQLSFIFALALFLQACTTHIATTHDFISSDKSKVVEASQDVANQLSMDKTVGPLDATIFCWGALTPREEAVLPNADLYLKNRPNPSFYSTDVIGALQFTAGLSETEFTSIFGSNRGDAYAWSKLYPELIRQQIALTEKRQMPYLNPRKDPISFVALNTLSPILGLRYLERGNPLVEKPMLKKLYIQAAASDAITVGCLLGAVVAKNHQTKTGFVSAGVSIGLLMRILTMTNLVDLSEYNDLAHTPYNLGIIRQ